MLFECYAVGNPSLYASAFTFFGLFSIGSCQVVACEGSYHGSKSFVDGHLDVITLSTVALQELHKDGFSSHQRDFSAAAYAFGQVIISSCCTKSKMKSATWNRIYDAEYGKKKPRR